MIPNWVGNYIGIPFSPRGRDRTGLDCWGLVRLVLYEQFQIELPSFEEEYQVIEPRETSLIVEESKPLVNALQVVDPQLGDVVLLRFKGWACHVGVYVGDNFVLHVESGRNTIAQRLDSIYLKPRLVGYFRVS